MKNLKNVTGQMIIEVVIAFAVVAVALAGLVQIATRSTTNSGAAKRQAVATAHATKPLEFLEGEKEILGWEAFKATYNGNKCFDGVAIFNFASCAITGTEYTSTLGFTNSSTIPTGGGYPVEQITIVSQVTWREGSNTLKSVQTKVFTRY
ncbi:hypothetical protein A2395_01355 [Candidatus Amesbacteria bacterium RIFOXYB1_FULL_47_9]|uniref:Uncharacterized protein n=5 Tax=Candidatus Amesiibacteriota TaxID=1752730 RepID=A0A1F4ZU31_9BACT|nr:MAG: hypothetical protein A2395_01355 [Candidatus Amesbacteria bacterium RIFOXYB1_FULL_47_9]